MAFIKNIKLSNFKQFANFTVSCKESNILTGPNNAGKSSVLDALRIVSDVVRYSYRKRPGVKSLRDVGVCAFYNPPHSALSIQIKNVARNYSDEYASIQVTLDSGTRLHVFLHPEKAIEVYLETNNRLPKTGVKFRECFNIDLCIVPTLGPFEEYEDYLQDETVDANRNTRKSSRHFRNIALRMPNYDFEKFQELVSQTWPSVLLKRPVREGPAITMMYEEGRIPREVFWSGFGLQVWFQMLLQIMRGSSNSIFVLDEPDIYLHADIQRRLLRICQGRFGQRWLG